LRGRWLERQGACSPAMPRPIGAGAKSQTAPCGGPIAQAGAVATLSAKISVVELMTYHGSGRATLENAMTRTPGCRTSPKRSAPWWCFGRTSGSTTSCKTHSRRATPFRSHEADMMQWRAWLHRSTAWCSVSVLRREPGTWSGSSPADSSHHHTFPLLFGLTDKVDRTSASRREKTQQLLLESRSDGLH
jgi:hypothetical protein